MRVKFSRKLSLVSERKQFIVSAKFCFANGDLELCDVFGCGSARNIACAAVPKGGILPSPNNGLALPPPPNQFFFSFMKVKN